MIPFVTEYRFGDDLDVINHKAVYVQYRGSGKYIITPDRHDVINRDGEVEWEPSPSNRDDDFIERTRFELEEALTIAERYYYKPNR